MSEKKSKMMEAIMKQMELKTGPKTNAVLNSNNSTDSKILPENNMKNYEYSTSNDIYSPVLRMKIKELLETQTSRFEIEASFGMFKNKNFNPGLKSFQIINLQRHLDRLIIERGGTLHLKTYFNTVDKISNNNVRRIVSKDDTIYQKKDRFSIDNIDNSIWGIRISKSREEYVDSTDFDEKRWDFLNTILENPKLKEDIKEKTYSPVIGIRRIRNRRSYTDSYTNSFFYGTTIDITSVKEISIKEDGTLFTISKHEVEIERTNNSLKLEGFINSISRIIQFYQNATNIAYILDQKEIHMAIILHNKIFEEDITRVKNKIVAYNKIFGDYRNKPKNIKTQYMLEKNFDPLVTIKLDGVRYTLFFSENGTYIFNAPDDVVKIGPINKKLIGTVLDCEYLSVYDENLQKTILSAIYGFDILFFKGKDVRRLEFNERFDIMRKVSSDVGILYGVKYHTKIFFQDGDFYDRSIKAFEEIERNDVYKKYDLVDGLIFQPKNWYKNNQTYKWKDEKNLTIDFIFSPMSFRQIEEDESISSDNYHKKFFQLIMGAKTGNVIFYGSNSHPISGYTMLDSEIFDQIDISGQIVESYWDSKLNLFLPRRIRDDKDRPNFNTTVLDVWEDITNPISKSTIEGDTLQLVRKYHNSKKLFMLKSFKENSTIIDIGSGRGGDLGKWDKTKMKRVYTIEPNSANLKELLRRKKESDIKTDIKVLNIGAEETFIISKELKKYKDKSTFDGIVTFSSLTYFPKNKELYNNLLKTINLIPKGKKFIGNVMEGERVRSLLETSRTNSNLREDEVAEYITKAFTIRQVTEFDDDIIGNEIEIDITDPTSMVKSQTEWLFYFEPFRKTMEGMGFKLISSGYIDNGDKYNVLPKASKMFSRLYRTFTFLRESINGVEDEEGLEGEEEIEDEEGLEDEEEIEDEIGLSKLYNENLYYTVVQKDSSNFIHAVLRAISPDYFKMDQLERSNYASKIRKTISKKVTKEMFKSLHDGELSKCLLEPHLKKHSYEESLKIAFLQFKLELSNTKEWTGSNFLLELTSILLGIDIYILSLLDNQDDLTVSKKFYKICNKLYINEKSVVLVTFDDKYYDIVGRKYRSNIFYIYNSSSVFIKSIRNEICN
jgi:hypothetical protein